MPERLERTWSLATARALLPEVRERTRVAVDETEQLLAERNAAKADSPERRAADERVQRRVSRWAREMEALGLEVKGVWLVDFDTGGGYYCWRWPEEGLDYFHGYDEGFDGRTRIQ
ncbi:MAG: DUF2203 family protein [Myxococcota bacterium]|nr:DUF2203 family protein [Myxococcota bacterium]